MNLLNKSVAMLPVMAFAGTIPLSVNAQATEEDNQYNILFIASDDLNSDAFNNPAVHTPNFDRLTEMGVNFVQAYNQAPISGPSRASIMTGYYPDKTEVYDLGPTFRDALPDAVSLPQMFKDNGYYTCRIGKIYHQGVPGGIGQPGHDDPLSWTTTFNPIGKDKTDEYLLVADAPGLGNYLAMDATDDETTDGISANIAVSIMRERTGNKHVGGYGGYREEVRPNPQPFFLAVGFYRPHIPYMAPQKYFDMHPLEDIQLAENPEDDWDDKPIAAAWTWHVNDGTTEEQQKKAIQAYYASISLIDAQVGKLIDAMEEFGLLENTIIVFWSDHGYHLGEHGQWQKQTLFEQSAKQPFFMSVPGYTKGEESDAVVQMVDIYPTLAELCGLEAPDDLAGNSLVPLMEDPNADWDHPAYSIQARTLNTRAQGEYRYTFNPMISSSNPTIFGRSIRVERYRYTEWDEGKEGVELYDYENDPKEFNNLADNPEYADLVDELAEQLHAFYLN